MLDIYKASAGSGKTYKLAYQYLLLTLRDPFHPDRLNGTMPRAGSGSGKPYWYPNRHRHIMAITFTVKATGEMKDRIIKSMQQVSQCDDPKAEGSPYTGDLLKDLHCDRPQLAKAAYRALREILYHYDMLHVSTIDSFFQTVLREFSREIDKDGDFDLAIEERQALMAGINGVLRTLEDGASHPALEEILTRMMESNAESDARINIFKRGGELPRRLYQLLQASMAEEYGRHAQEVKDYLSDQGQPGSRVSRYADALRQYQKACRDTVQKELRALDAFLRKNEVYSAEDVKATAYITKKAIGFLRKLETRIDEAGSSDIEYRDILDNAFGKRAAKGEKAGIYNNLTKKSPTSAPEREKVEAEIIKHIQTASRAHSEMELCKKLRNPLDDLCLLGYALQEIEKYRVDNNLILISDTNDLLHTIIDGADIPFIYERLGIELEHLLIDEFQDTSDKQWSNLRPLVSEALSNGFGQGMLIGDEKQSIYRFRNANSRLLHNEALDSLRLGPGQHATWGDDPAKPTTNYRSRENIVLFNNTLFSLLGQDAYAREYYQNVCQALPSGEPKAERLGGYVNININQKESNTSAKTKDGPAEDEEAASCANVLDQMAEAMIDQNRRGFEWGEIAVLTSTNKEAAKVVDHINSNYPNIPVRSDEALYLRSSSAVRSVISILRSLQQQKDAAKGLQNAQSLAESLQNNDYLDDAQSREIINRYDYFLARHLTERDAARDAGDASETGPEHGRIDNLMQKALEEAFQPQTQLMPDYQQDLQKYLPSSLISIIEIIISHIPEERRRDQLAYLTALQDQVIEFCGRHSSIYHFLKVWDTEGRYKWTLTASAGEDAVNVLTIHKSKGLEFQCVHIPYLEWELKDSREWFDLRPVGEDGAVHAVDFPPGIDPEVAPPVLRLKNGQEWLDPASSPLWQQARVFDDAMRLDQLNKAYVAFTRAISELRVWGIAAAKPSLRPSKMTDAMRDAFGHLGDEPAGDQAALKTRCAVSGSFPSVSITLGEPVRVVPKKKMAPQPNKLSYRVTLRDTGEDVTRAVHNHRVGMPIFINRRAFISEDQIMQGQVLHTTMSQIRTLADVDNAFHAVARGRFFTTEEQRQKYRGLLDTMLDPSLPIVQRWFGPGVKALREQPIFDPSIEEDEDAEPENDKKEKTPSATRRPDRVVIWTDAQGQRHTDVVDFKFGLNPSDWQKEKYRQQVLGYMDWLQRAGLPNVRGYLWYASNPKHPEEILDSHAHPTKNN